MTTQVIRDTFGVITTGKFCLFGGSSKEKAISCDNATNEVKLSIAMNAAKFLELDESEREGKLFEIMRSATAIYKGSTLPFHQIEAIGTVTHEGSEEDWSYDNLPEDFELLDSTLITTTTTIYEPQTFKFKFADEFEGWVIFVTPEQDNKSIVNNGIEMSFCLSPLSNV